MSSYLNWLPLLFVGLAAFSALDRLTHTAPLGIKIVAVMWLVVLPVEVAGHVTAAMGIRNHILYNIFDIGFFSAIYCAYMSATITLWKRRAYAILSGIFTIYSLVNLVFIQGVDHFNSYTYVIGGTLAIAFGTSYLYELLAYGRKMSVRPNPFFWFSAGFMVYFIGTIPFLGALNYYWEHYKTFSSLYFTYFSNGFSILLNLSMIVGFYAPKLFRDISYSG